MVLVDGLFWYTPCAVVTKVVPLSPSVKSQGPALISCAQGLKIIRFGALTLPKHSDWEYTSFCQLPSVFRQTHRHCEGHRKTSTEIGLAKDHTDLG